MIGKLKAFFQFQGIHWDKRTAESESCKEYNSTNRLFTVWFLGVLPILLPQINKLQNFVQQQVANLDAWLLQFPAGTFLVEKGVTAWLGNYLLQLVSIGVLFGVLYKLFQGWHRCQWIRENPRYMLKGNWLMIHKKVDGEVRLGCAKFDQNYYDYDVTASNIWSCDADGDLVERPTDWRYYTSRMIKSAENDNHIDTMDLVAFYGAHKRERQGLNLGTHQLFIQSYDDQTGWPTYMWGYFSDSKEIEEGDVQRNATPGGVNLVNMSNRYGHLYMYRIDDKLAKKRELKEFLENAAAKTDNFANLGMMQMLLTAEMTAEKR